MNSEALIEAANPEGRTANTVVHGLIEFGIGESSLEPRILLIQLLEAFGLGGFHPPV